MQIVSDDPKKIRLPLPARIILSFSLVLAAFLISFSLRNTVGYLVFLGMAISCLGDLFNAEVIPLPVPLLGGMTAFGVAHCLYIAALNLLIKPTGILTSTWFWIGLVAAWMATAIAWRLLIYNPERIPALRYGSLIYALLIGTMAYFTIIVGITLGGWWWLLPLGALFFYISDTIIGVYDIGKTELKKPELWIWLTYVLGQMGIIYGTWIGFTM